MVEEKLPSAQFPEFRLPIADARIIRVSQHRRDRRDVLQVEDDGRIANVASMQDVVHAGEELRDARVEETVRVGKDAEFHK